ncbi:tetratricopeptide repeat protein [Larkinella arboricola]
MRSCILLLFSITSLGTLAQRPKLPNQSSSVNLTNSNNAVVKVIQAGTVGTVANYNLAIPKDVQQLLDYLKSVPSIAKQLNQLSQGVNRLEQNDESQNNLLMIIARNTSKEGIFSIDAYNKGLEKYIKENDELKAEVAQLKLKNKDTELASVLNKAEEQLKQFNNEGYQELLETFKQKRKSKWQQEKEEVAHVSYLQAQNNINQFKYGKALQQIDEALGLIVNPIYLILKGQIYTDLYRLQEAIEVFSQIDTTALSDKLRKDFYNSVGYTYSQNGKPDKAIENYEKSLSIAQRTLGDDHPDLITYYSNIGVAYSLQGENEKAIESLNKGLKIALNAYDPNHLDVALCYGNLGFALSNKKDYDIAIFYFNKSLNIIVNKLGDKHPDAASIYISLGAAYADKRDYERAIEYYNKALIIRRKVFGEDHPEVAVCYNSLGIVSDRQGKHDKAIEYYNKSLKINLKLLGVDHPEVATLYNNIAISYSNKEDYENSFIYFNKSLAIRTKILGTESNSTQNTLRNMGNTYIINSHIRKGLTLLKKVKTYNNSTNIEKAEYFYQIGSNLYGSGKYSSAVNFLKLALRFLEQGNASATSWLWVFTYYSLGSSYCSLENKKKASKCLKGLIKYEGKKTIGSSFRSDLEACIMR